MADGQELDFQPEAHQALETARARISESDLAGDGKDVGGNHVTVRYGLKPGTDTAKIKEYLSSLSPFDATLGKTAKFKPSESSDNAAVIQAPIQAPELDRINKEIEKHGDFAPSDFPSYTPHATIAYVKPEVADRYVGMTATEGKKFRVESIGISDREGKVDVPPHWHPMDENITVISGIFRAGFGQNFSQDALRDLPAGSYAMLPCGVPHFNRVKGETVLQSHGIGPYDIKYVNPSDDPSKRPIGK